MTVRATRLMCIAGALMMVLCSPKNHPVLNDSSVAEAALLKESIAKATSLKSDAESKKVAVAEKATADSLTDLAVAKQKAGKTADGYWMAELATTYYKLALAKHALAATETRLKKLEGSLAQAKGQLQTYKEVLNELESIKKQ